MTQAGYHTLIEHYESCLAAHGDTHRGVDWPNALDAETRYRVMLEVAGGGGLDRRAGAPPPSILDFGCGAAHLCEHLERTGRGDVEYIGLDASEKFVDLCRNKFPRRTFLHRDVLADDEPLPEVDFLIMNGVATEKRGMTFDDMLAYMERLLVRVFAAVRVGMAFNVMSAHVDWQRDDLFHVPYDALAALLKRRLSRHFLFRADYGLYEYTTYVYRNPR
jgi:SAM-dependent methyltransferase